VGEERVEGDNRNVGKERSNPAIKPGCYAWPASFRGERGERTIRIREAKQWFPRGDDIIVTWATGVDGGSSQVEKKRQKTRRIVYDNEVT